MSGLLNTRRQQYLFVRKIGMKVLILIENWKCQTILQVQ